MTRRPRSTEEVIRKAKLVLLAQDLDNPDLFWPVKVEINPALLVDHQGQRPVTRAEVKGLGTDDKTLLVILEW